jgi:AcrR family transcriptional regulator
VTAGTGQRRRRRNARGSGEQLHDEIVLAAKKLMAEADRADDVPVRAVADAVGVTSPSIYLHFADKQELLNAVVVDVFRELDEEMLAAGRAESSPMARLRAFGMAYVRFAVRHPQHYRLAMLDACAGPMTEVDEIIASSAFAHFHETVQECIAAGVFPGGDALTITFDLWSAAHGVAGLLIAKPYLPYGTVDEFADRALCAAAAGQAVRLLLGGNPSPEVMTAWLAEQHPGGS